MNELQQRVHDLDCPAHEHNRYWHNCDHLREISCCTAIRIEYRPDLRRWFLRVYDGSEEVGSALMAYEPICPFCEETLLHTETYWECANLEGCI